MKVEPRILVVAARGDRFASLCRGLDSLGWSTVSAHTAAAGAAALRDLPLEAAIVDLENGGGSMLATLKQAAAPRSLPIIAVASNPVADAELTMSRPPHPAQAALRLEQLTRTAVAAEEFRLRQATLKAHGVDLAPPSEGEPPLRVLAAGAPDRRFLALSNSLCASGAEVVAAPTPYTAFDYLHESAFDAAVLWGGQDHAPALSIAAGMKRNTRLYHIPVVLYLRTPADMDLGELYNRGVADVAAADVDETETAERILALARTHRRHQAVRRALDAARGAPVMDPATGLFTPKLFAAHLARVADSARERRRPLSACVLRVVQSEAVSAARRAGWLDRALPQIGAMISRLVRIEDTPARLAPEVFALALPATRGPEARLAAERIAAVIGCTAFDAGPDRPPFVAEFEVGCAELGWGENPAALLERASAGLMAARA